MVKPYFFNIFRFGFVLLLVMVPIQVAFAASISLDGAFGDWTGQPCINDVSGDAPTADDLITFCFVTDQSNDITYYYLERVTGSTGMIDAIIELDINDDGDYTDVGDRRLEIRYDPQKKKSKVTVDLFDGTGSSLGQLAKNENWGASTDDGGGEFEFSASFADLGITPGVASSISMIASSGNNGGSDQTNVVQWTPANILDWPILLGIMLVASIGFAFFSQKRKISA